MPADDLFKLWKLHEVDSTIAELRAKAAALDPGKKLMAEIKALEAKKAETEKTYHELHGEQSDLELKQKSISDKIKKIEADLYGGKIVSSREVEAFQKDVAMLKKQREEFDGRVMELWDLVPPAKAAVAEMEKEIAAKRAELKEHQTKVMAYKGQIEELFKQNMAKRPDAAKGIPPAMLSRYDNIRQKADGVAMTRVNKGGFCSTCGMHLAEKLIESAREGRMAMCEGCGRILYWSESVV
ncbi:MAG: hypothetical protein KF784_03350 [Fimbriimonadaceae bacterium]|nr:hypothetical protein [Fimbriimonadaceae bacterium]